MLILITELGKAKCTNVHKQKNKKMSFLKSHGHKIREIILMAYGYALRKNQKCDQSDFNF